MNVDVDKRSWMAICRKEDPVVQSRSLMLARLRNVCVDVERLRSHFLRQVATRPPIAYRDNRNDYAGWAVTSRDGRVEDGVRRLSRRPSADGGLVHGATPTALCTDYLAEVMDHLASLGIAPYRARIMRMESEGTEMPFHRDAMRQAWRLHVPIITNPDCRFEWRRDDGSVESVHLPADGSAWLVRVDVEHRAINRSCQPSSRVHLLMGLGASPPSGLLAPPWLPLAQADAMAVA